METIIDGYNMIFRLGWQGKAQHSLSLEKARERLISELAGRIPANSRSAITIVFDAKNAPIKDTSSNAQARGMRVIFAANHDEADALIEELIAHHSAPKSLTVVSDDNRLQTAARRRKAKAIGCEPWWEELGFQADPGLIKASEESAKDQAIKQLGQTDWGAEFQIDEKAEDPNTSAPQQPDHFNPFPPGYGEDLLE